MYKYGFELEGFQYNSAGFVVPDSNLPTDGFPGLVEARTVGADTLESAYFNLLQEVARIKQTALVSFSAHSLTFTPREQRELRRRMQYKDQVDVRSLYGKAPRALGNKTIASLQINVSYQVCPDYYDKTGVHHPARYGLFDVPRVVRALDRTFETEIRLAKRQPGEYCIKEARLEYRSLPNAVFVESLGLINVLLDRIRNAVEKA